MSLATGVAFGLFPALHCTRADLVSTLKGQAGQPAGARAASRFRTSLATAQIALSMALLALAGLFTKSLFKVSRVDLGLNAGNVITFGISPELSNYTPQQSRALFERVEDELAAVPGVTGVTASRVSLIAGSNWSVFLDRLITTLSAAFAVLATLLALVALGAGFIPAFRASRIDPMQARRAPRASGPARSRAATSDRGDACRPLRTQARGVVASSSATRRAAASTAGDIGAPASKHRPSIP